LISVATTEVFAVCRSSTAARKRPRWTLGNHWQTFSPITVPNLRLSIIGAALLIFTLSMDEIAVSFS
jgi:spermidine/putrescine transport system permease protein